MSFVQLFGSALQVTPHFHSLMPDGVFVLREDEVRFEPLPPPTQAEMERLLRVVHHRVLRLLGRGELPAQGPEDAQQAYTKRIPCNSDCAGRRRTSGSLAENSPGAPSWRDSPCTPIRICMPTTGKGWSGYAATGTRCARAGAFVTSGGWRIAYRMKRPPRDGTTHLLFTGLELLRLDLGPDGGGGGGNPLWM